MCIIKVNLCVDPPSSDHQSVTNFNIGSISDAVCGRVVEVGQRVACGGTLQMMWPWVTLTFGRGHGVNWKI